jgi:dihydroxyacid dehydratase/phosphogluconate dehydratase
MIFLEHRYVPFSGAILYANSNLTKAMLYAAGVKNRHAMKNSPQIGIASVWWEGNPCK